MEKTIPLRIRTLRLLEAETNAQDSKSEGGAYLEMELHEGENSEVISDNDTAREGDSTDDMTDMMTKRVVVLIIH